AIKSEFAFSAVAYADKSERRVALFVNSHIQIIEMLLSRRLDKIFTYHVIAHTAAETAPCAHFCQTACYVKRRAAGMTIKPNAVAVLLLRHIRQDFTRTYYHTLLLYSKMPFFTV